MIDRYTRPEMGKIWELENRFNKMKEVELAVAAVQSILKIIPRKAYLNIQKKAKFSVKRIAEIEQQTKHDVIAFVSNLAENVGEDGKYIHYGLTSSDVLDTAFSLQIQDAGEVLLDSIQKLEIAFQKLIKAHWLTLCPGRTHGMFAEPTTFGYKLSGFYSELVRNKNRLKLALNQAKICKLSGAVGTYSSLPREVEIKVAKKLDLIPETVATQVVPRDRHAEVLFALAMLGAGYERLAIELRHLQRNEVAEVIEGFQKGQKGSSAMPHKKNPISAENITGISRLLKSYLQAGIENIPLWHERDISHSSVERVIFPDAFIAADYATVRLETLLSGLYVDEQKMKHNISLSQGQLYSSQVLLLLVKKGQTREQAYALVQRVSHQLKPGEELESALLKDDEIKKYVTKLELEKIFSGQSLLASMKKLKGKIK